MCTEKMAYPISTHILHLYEMFWFMVLCPTGNQMESHLIQLTWHYKMLHNSFRQIVQVQFYFQLCAKIYQTATQILRHITF